VLATLKKSVMEFGRGRGWGAGGGGGGVLFLKKNELKDGYIIL